ncbi:unnamed protein product [Prunus armeniaca]
MGCGLRMLAFGASGPGGRSGPRAPHCPGSAGMESVGLADTCWLLVDQPCLSEMVARLQALSCLCICGEVLKCTRRGLWPTCTNEGQFQRWRPAYVSAIPDDVHIKLAKPLTDVVPCVDAHDPNARIITFHPFYFSLGFKFPMSKIFKEVFCAMGCAPSQCTPNVYG